MMLVRIALCVMPIALCAAKIIAEEGQQAADDTGSAPSASASFNIDTHFPVKLTLPMKSDPESAKSVVLPVLVGSGFTSLKSAQDLCASISQVFDTNYDDYASTCVSRMTAEVRIARAFNLLHADVPEFKEHVTTLHTKLIQDAYLDPQGFAQLSWWTSSTLRFTLSRLVAGIGKKLDSVCMVGFEYGHAALASLLFTDATLYVFEEAASGHVMAAQDYLDTKFPDRLLLFAGNASFVAPRMRKLYPEATCQLLIVHGTLRSDIFSAGWNAMKRLISKDAPVLVTDVMVNGAVWEEVLTDSQAGFLEWDVTVPSNDPNRVHIVGTLTAK